MKYDLGKANRLGNRTTNQDRFAVIERPETVLLVLADGMGGHEGGMLAANILVVKFTEACRAASTPIPDPAKFLREAFMASHHAIVDAGARQTPPITPRTTGVACLIQNGSVWWAHIGDSRFYLFRHGKPVARTRDHSFVEDLLQKGKISEKRLRSHPQRNQVTRCVGGTARKTPEPTVADPQALEPNDVVLLCSDGLWGGLDDEVLAVTLGDQGSMAQIIDQLAEQAEVNSYPKCDNVSAIALRWIDGAAVKKPNRTADVAPSVANAPAKNVDPTIDAAIDEINQALRRAEEDIKRIT